MEETGWLGCRARLNGNKRCRNRLTRRAGVHCDWIALRAGQPRIDLLCVQERAYVDVVHEIIARGRDEEHRVIEAEGSGQWRSRRRRGSGWLDE